MGLYQMPRAGTRQSARERSRTTRPRSSHPGSGGGAWGDGQPGTRSVPGNLDLRNRLLFPAPGPLPRGRFQQRPLRGLPGDEQVHLVGDGKGKDLLHHRLVLGGHRGGTGVIRGAGRIGIASSAAQRFLARSERFLNQGRPFGLVGRARDRSHRAGLGALFGGSEVATVAFSEELGTKALAGPLLAVWALGSLLSGVVTGAVTWRAADATRAGGTWTLPDENRPDGPQTVLVTGAPGRMAWMAAWRRCARLRRRPVVACPAPARDTHRSLNPLTRAPSPTN